MRQQRVRAAPMPLLESLPNQKVLGFDGVFVGPCPSVSLSARKCNGNLAGINFEPFRAPGFRERVRSDLRRL